MVSTNTPLPAHRYINGAPIPVSLSDAAALTLLAALELVAVVAAVRIWREKGRSRAARLGWILLILVPVVGLLAYALLHDPPPPNDPIDRPPGRYRGL